jgi:hypothetical protein
MQYRDELLPSLISPTSASYTNSVARSAAVSIVVTPTVCPQTLRRTLYIEPVSRSETGVHHRPKSFVGRCKQPVAIHAERRCALYY